MSFLGGLLNIRRTDKDLHARLYGYTQGPVRLIRRARYWFPLPFGLRARGRIDLIFYPDFVEGTAPSQAQDSAHVLFWQTAS